MNTRSRGFSLIELLVVVAIFSLLSSLVLATTRDAKTRSQDATRISDMRQMVNALELYFASNNQYPNIDNASSLDASCTGNAAWQSLETQLSEYIVALPCDPTGVDVYEYDADSGDSYTTFGVRARLQHSSNASVTANDGGFSSVHIEMGEQPSYCSSAYVGADSQWLSAGGNLCVGGN